MKDMSRTSAQTIRGGRKLLTADEVIEILRLDARGLKNPKEVLRHLRRTRQIGFTKIGGRVHYTQQDIEDFIARNHVEALKK